MTRFDIFFTGLMKQKIESYCLVCEHIKINLKIFDVLSEETYYRSIHLQL